MYGLILGPTFAMSCKQLLSAAAKLCWNQTSSYAKRPLAGGCRRHCPVEQADFGRKSAPRAAWDERSFTDAKAAEDRAEQIVGGELAGDGG
jgi:hypothetical protein